MRNRKRGLESEEKRERIRKREREMGEKEEKAVVEKGRSMYSMIFFICNKR